MDDVSGQNERDREQDEMIRRVDGILTEAVFLQEAKPSEAMPHALASQAYALRGEKEAVRNELNRAPELEPENVRVQISACSLNYDVGDIAAARRHLAQAERLDPEFPLVPYWKSSFALTVEQDREAALMHVDRLWERALRFALAHVLRGWILSTGPNADFPATSSTSVRRHCSSEGSSRRCSRCPRP